MLNKILFVIILFEFTLSFYNYLSFSLHMLQLSSYHNPTHKLYENNHSRFIYAPYKAFLLIPSLSMMAGGGLLTPLLIFSALLMAWFSYISKPLPAKKPFVVTARVKRLYTTALLLFLICTYLAFNCPLCRPAFLLSLMGAFSIFIYPFTRLCNSINHPIEKAISNYYIHDAEKILKSRPEMTVIGITGSFGKTSTKYFLNSILSDHFQSLMTPESYNTTMGVVRTIREQLRPTHTHFVVEMGARHEGEIKEICDIVHPNMGIITSIGEQHLETFLTLDTIVKTKMELYQAVKDKGTVFLNIDSPAIRDNIPAHGKIITYGIANQADYNATDLTVNELGISFCVRDTGGNVCRFTTKLLGAHNVVNILGAIAVANTLGVPLFRMTSAVARLTPVPHRLEIKPAGENVIIDDAYNSNPIGAKAALDALNLCQGMKIIVTPGMVELGERENELNYEFGCQISDICDFVCLVGKKDHIYEGLMSKNYPKDKIFRTLDVKEAINHALALEKSCEGKKYILLENDLPDNY